MTTIFLIRHGVTAQTGKILYGQLPGLSLDDRGRAQAASLVPRFAGVRLTALYSSPLERCVETVEPLAAAQRLAIRTSDALIEMDAGAWTGRRLSQLRRTKDWKVVQRSPASFAFPGGGERFDDAATRVGDEVARIARRHRGGRVAIATHGDLVRIVVARFLGLPLDGFQRIVIDTGSVTVLHTDGRERTHVVLVNDTGGLSRFGATPTPPWEASHGRPHAKLRG